MKTLHDVRELVGDAQRPRTDLKRPNGMPSFTQILLLLLHLQKEEQEQVASQKSGKSQSDSEDEVSFHTRWYCNDLAASVSNSCNNFGRMKNSSTRLRMDRGLW
jgi:hypothetical protein